MKTQNIIAVAILSGCALFVTIGCSTALAEDAPLQEKLNRTISVSGTGSVRVKPDIATASLGASKSSVKLSEAKASCDQTINQIKSSLKKSGVDDEDIRTVQYQIYRVNANPQAGVRESQWKVVHMLQVRTEKPDKIASIVDAAVNAGATDVQNISFSVDSLAKHRTKSRELAIEAAKEKAMQLAALLKVNVGEVISVSEGGDGYYPMAQMSANMSMDSGGYGGGGSGISGGQIEVASSAQVVFAIR
ncbi:MAG: SIMPL domain-containing protein [Chlorobia bacterium]|nr:SIMPL domain-containing protein [Fimbriimonadaceae bacterium]